MQQQIPLEKQYSDMSVSERNESRFKKAIDELKSRLATTDVPLSDDERQKIKDELDRELGRMVALGNLERRIDRFENPEPAKTARQRLYEAHRSQRLGNNMRAAGRPRPDKCCQAHAIIAGGDPDAFAMRTMLAFELMMK